MPVKLFIVRVLDKEFYFIFIFYLFSLNIKYLSMGFGGADYEIASQIPAVILKMRKWVSHWEEVLYITLYEWVNNVQIHCILSNTRHKREFYNIVNYFPKASVIHMNNCKMKWNTSVFLIISCRREIRAAKCLLHKQQQL